MGIWNVTEPLVVHDVNPSAMLIVKKMISNIVDKSYFC